MFGRLPTARRAALVALALVIAAIGVSAALAGTAENGAGSQAYAVFVVGVPGGGQVEVTVNAGREGPRGSAPSSQPVVVSFNGLSGASCFAFVNPAPGAYAQTALVTAEVHATVPCVDDYYNPTGDFVSVDVAWSGYGPLFGPYTESLHYPGEPHSVTQLIQRHAVAGGHLTFKGVTYDLVQNEPNANTVLETFMSHLNSTGADPSVVSG